jgi:Fe-S cluster assembly protein SufB
MDVRDRSAEVTHEATVGRVGAEQLFFLMSRGIPEEEATGMVVQGFIEPIAKELPLEHAVELNNLLQYEMGGRHG